MGDVVKAKTEHLFFEGVVVGIDGDDVTVDFGEEELTTVAYGNCRKKLSWDTVEVGDTVLVKEEQGALSYEAKVIRSSASRDGPIYAVNFGGDDDDDIEEKVSWRRLRKIASERSTHVKRWRNAGKLVMGLNALKRAALLSPQRRASQQKLPPRFDDIEAEVVVVGDVVRALAPGEDEHREGFVEGVTKDMVDVYFKDTKTSAFIPTSCVTKIKCWSHIELGDKVQALSNDDAAEKLWYDAIVVDVKDDTYTVRWDHHNDDDDDDDTDTEDNVIEVTKDRVRKLESGRSRGLKRWHSVHNLFGVMQAFHSSLLSEEEEDNENEEKAAPAVAVPEDQKQQQQRPLTIKHKPPSFLNRRGVSGVFSDALLDDDDDDDVFKDDGETKKH